MFLILQVLMVALYVVAVVRSRGVARILLAIWAALSLVMVVLSVISAPIVNAIGVSMFSLLFTGLNFVGSVLLGVAILLGRPGVYQPDATQYFYAGPPPVYGQPGPSPIGGDQARYGVQSPYADPSGEQGGSGSPYAGQ